MENTELVSTGKKEISISDIQLMAKAMGPLFKKKPDDMFALMLIAHAEGLHPAIAAQEYDIIDGRPSINSRSALARFQKAGGMVKYIERTDSVCTIDFSHPVGGKITVSWTIKMAEQAGLLGKDNWKKYKRAMLNARCISEGVRALYPACLSGLYTSEEVQDMPEMDSPIIQQATQEEKSKRKEVIEYISSVTDQIPNSEMASIKAELIEARNDSEKLEAIKKRVDSLISIEPTIKPVEKMSDAEDAVASAVFDEPYEQDLF